MDHHWTTDTDAMLGQRTSLTATAPSADIRHVQEILGHRRVDTTEAYTHLAISDLALAHAKTHPRGRLRR